MRKSAFLTIVLCLVASVGFSQMAEVEETIISKEKNMYEAIKKGDMDTFKANTSDDLISVYSDGYVTKDEEIERLSDLTIESYELSDIKVEEPAEGVAIVIYTLDASAVYQNEKISGKYYSTSTWVEKDGEWKAVMHTETEAAPMEEPVGMEERE